MMNKNVISIMVSADWHIGATNPHRFKTELIKTVKSVIKEKNGLDLFVVSGDTFDMKEYLSSDSVKVFFLIIAELLELTKEYKTQFRFIEGTRTHDALQLSTLKIVFENLLKNNRVKFIEEVSTEEIFGINILYLPEEYIENSELYYKDFFAKHYDFTFGHGNTDLMWFSKKLKEVKGASTPIFKSEDLSSIANYTYFGHFHYRVNSKDNKVKSIGPFSRWEFGKDGDCGLYYIEYDKTSNIAIEEYVQNEYAPILPTVIFNIKENYDLETLNKKISDKLIPIKDNADKTRLIVNINTSLENYIVMRDFILSSYGNMSGVTLMIKLVDNEESKVTENSIENIEKSVEDKPYLYDKNMHDEFRIAAFIRKKEGINISVESILDVIQKKDTKISARED